MIFNKNWKLFIMFGGEKPQWTFLELIKPKVLLIVQQNGLYKHHRIKE